MSTSLRHPMSGSLPRLRSFDCSLALLADPYRFIGERCRELGSDIFEARLMLRPTIFLHGARAAELFYDRDRFARAGAAPEPLRATLFGKGTVQSLDGEMHRRRKALFVAATTPESVAALVAETRRAWQRVVPRAGVGPVTLYDLAREALTRSVCAWAGVPLDEREVATRVRQLTLLFDGAAGGPRQHLRSRMARHQAERWLAALLKSARAGEPRLIATSIARLVADHVDADGKALPPRVAAAELLNFLRPTVAVSVFVVFAAHALHQHPEWRERLGRRGGDRAELDAFVQEVRRFYPFFPAVVAKTRDAFEWNGHRVPGGTRTMLDLFGTNHDDRCWQAPADFRPERFLGAAPEPYAFIPQGGGSVERNHRCPGEGIASALMAQAVELLLEHIDADVAAQDLSIDMARLPALPREHFRLQRVRWID